jgi:hypothetical protein
MNKKPKHDHAIFFRLPTAVVEQIDSTAFDLHTTRTQFIRLATFRALKECQR